MMCNCAYCKEGMSATAEECVDRRIAVAKALKDSAKKIDWNQVFGNIYKGDK